MIISNKIVGGLVACGLFAAVGSAQAATFVVNSTANTGDFADDGFCDADDSANDGPCTLRAAIQEANRNAAQDLITFDDGTFPEGGGTVIDTIALGITRPLTIAGPGESTVVVSGDGTNNVFEIDEDAPSPAGTSFEISGLRVRDGERGIRASNFSVDVILKSLAITSNGEVSDGGGVLNDNSNGTAATLKIQDCSITFNDASDTGGGVSSIGAKTEISNSFVFQNDVNLGDGFGGGVASTQESTTTITDSIISGNDANISGGGLYVDEGSTLTVIDSIISENETAIGDGGGVFLNDGATLNVTDSSLMDNTAANSGGGVAFFSIDPPTPLTTKINITGSLIFINTAFEDGGGVHVNGPFADFTKTILTISNSKILQNDADDEGGGINFDDATGSISGSSVSANTNDLLSGGSEGGGINNEGHLTIDNSTISFNSSGGEGGGIRNDSEEATLTITNSTISNNESVNDGAGGIDNDDDDTNTVTLINVTVTENLADSDFDGSGAGGGIRQDSVGGAFTITNSIVANNFEGSSPSDCNTSGTDVASGGNNIIGTDDGCADNTFDTAAKNDKVGSSGSEIDAKLGPLEDNGGPNATHLPLTGSPAIDGVNASIAAAPDADQRGFLRATDGKGDGTAEPDVGAVEVNGCGDGVVEGSETCDDGGESATCNANCTTSACGDGVVNATANETCDDANTTAGDGCSDTCQTEACGNLVLDSGEQCEDGNTTNGDGCSSTCQSEFGTVSATDTDGDGIPNATDNCPTVANADQVDTDGNGVGDACGGDSGGCSLIR